MKQTSLIFASASALIFTACENPADKTTAATVKDAVEVAASPGTQGVRYAFTSNSEILFTGSKVTGSHSGGFKKFTGSFTVADNALAGTGQKIVIDMNSLWSDDEKLTGQVSGIFL
jgi:polyisoprenoid-binding protein YceI